ncbi:MAG: FAD-dependent oxidoreductase, partial [Planctomycetota bacterium]
RPHSEFRRSFRYFRGGIGTLHERFATAIAQRGAKTNFGRRLIAIEHADSLVTGLRFADGSHERGFDYVLSTIPLATLVTATLPARAPDLLRANHLPFRAMAFVFLRVAKAKLLDWQWIYYSGASTPFQRLTEFSHFGAGMCPPGQTGLSLEVSCEVGDSTWNSSDADLIARCVDHLIALGHLRREELLGADVRRTTHAYPLQVKNFPEKAEALVDALAATCHNLVTIGRQGLFRYCNMNECMEMALDTAPRILAGASSIRYQSAGTWRGIGITDSYRRRKAARPGRPASA